MIITINRIHNKKIVYIEYVCVLYLLCIYKYKYMHEYIYLKYVMFIY